MNFAKNLFVLSTLLLATTATAQLRTNQVTQTRGTSYNGGIGNSYLGGSVSAHALLTTTTGIMGNRGTLDLGANAAVNLLGGSANIALVSATGSNGTSAFSFPRGVQTRSGNFHVQVIGIDLINSTYYGDSSFARQTWTFNAFANGVSASIPVGPVSITLRGNVGAGLTISASYGLPATSLTVSAGGYAQAYGFADASVGVGIPGFSLGVGINGHILQQNFTMLCGATVGSGFFGVVSYDLVPISLTLYAYAEAFWHRWTTNLTSWSSAAVDLTLF